MILLSSFFVSHVLSNDMIPCAPRNYDLKINKGTAVNSNAKSVKRTEMFQYSVNRGRAAMSDSEALREI
jgi:hypothetical protein